MRKIHSREHEEKRRKKNRLALVFIMIFVLFGSVFGIIVNSFDNNSSTSSTKYNGFSFTQSGNFWTTSINSLNLNFVYNPLETENLSYENNLTRSYGSYNKIPVYIYSEDSSSEIEVYKNLFSLAERVQNACPEGKQCNNTDWPVKDCSENLIIIQVSDKNKITQNQNCVYIQGQKEDLLKLSDEFLFRIFGIKK